MQLTIWQVREAVARHFSDLGDEVVDTMTAVCLAESGGDTEALLDNYPQWQAEDSPARYDRGLAQINSQHGFDPLRLFDPDYNLECARIIFGWQGFRAWTAYNAGLHLRWLPLVQPLDAPEPPQDESAGAGSATAAPQPVQVTGTASIAVTNAAVAAALGALVGGQTGGPVKLFVELDADGTVRVTIEGLPLAAFAGMLGLQ